MIEQLQLLAFMWPSNTLCFDWTYKSCKDIYDKFDCYTEMLEIERMASRGCMIPAQPTDDEMKQEDEVKAESDDGNTDLNIDVELDKHVDNESKEEPDNSISSTHFMRTKRGRLTCGIFMCCTEMQLPLMIIPTPGSVQIIQ